MSIPSTPAARPETYRLLIAEDDREIGELLVRYFRARGVEVEIAHDGETAWRMFVAQPPDVLLTDLMMPRLSGRDLVTRVRSHLTRARTPVVVMAASLSSPRDEQELVAQMRVDGAFRKPLALKDLLACVDGLAQTFSGRHRTVSSARLPPVTPPSGSISASRLQPVTSTAGVTTSPRLAPVTPPSASAPARTRPPTVEWPAGSIAGGPVQTVVGKEVPTAPPAPRPAPPPGRPHFDPFAEVPPTPGPEAARRQTTGRLPAVRTRVQVPGAPSLSVLVGEFMRAFESHTTGVMAVHGPDVVRMVSFVDGVIVDVRSNSPHESDGAALVEHGLINSEQERALGVGQDWNANLPNLAVQRLGLKPSQVVMALEQHARLLLRRVLLSSTAASPIQPIPEPAVLLARFRLDPLEALMDACLRLPHEGMARDSLAEHADLHVHRGSAFNERVVVFARLRPQSAVPGMVLDAPLVSEAVRRVGANGSHGAREFLALLLCQALHVAGPDDFPPPSPRAAVLGAAALEWHAAHLDAHDMALREAVAREWIRTNGSTPHKVLNVPPEADEAALRQSHGVAVQRFGPPALDSSDLGPAKTYLTVVRARRDAALHTLLRR